MSDGDDQNVVPEQSKDDEIGVALQQVESVPRVAARPPFRFFGNQLKSAIQRGHEPGRRSFASGRVPSMSFLQLSLGSGMHHQLTHGVGTCEEAAS